MKSNLLKIKLLEHLSVGAMKWLMAIVLLAPISSMAQITFTTLTTANGLPTNSVNGVTASGMNVYAATPSGFAVSNNGGTTFSTKTTADGLGNNIVYDVFLDGSTIYAATLGGLSISTDGGNSFTNYTTGLFAASNLFLDVYVDGSTIYVAGFYGFFISTDGGATFTRKTTTDGLGSNICSGVVADGSNVFVATDGGLSISTDGGNTFTNKTLADGLANTDADGVAMSGSTVYVVSEGFDPVGGLSITSDMGASFTVKQQADGLAANSVNNVYVVGDNLYVGTSGSSISVSHDGGSTFTVYGFFDGIPGVTSDTYVDGNILYVATSNGIAFGEDTDASNDSDNDGVLDENDNCPGTPAGKGVNAEGCSCTQLTVDDGDPCTLDECVDGMVTNTRIDADMDGFTTCEGDCDDSDPAIHPDAVEACDGVDNDWAVYKM